MDTGKERIKNFPPRARCKSVLGDSFTQKQYAPKKSLYFLVLLRKPHILKQSL